MGIDKIKKKKKKKPNQLVSKRKDGKRPGYYGSDAGFGDYDDSPSSSGGNGGNGGSNDESMARDSYISQQYTAPAPEPEPEYDTADFAFTTPSPSQEPDTSGDDQEDDVANMMMDMGFISDPEPDTSPDTSEDDFVNPLDEFGIKGNVYAGTVYDDSDTGDSLYVSPTLRTKEEEPYYGYKPGPNTVTLQELSDINNSRGDNEYLDMISQKIQAANPIEKQGFFDSGIGKVLKTAGAIAAPILAPALLPAAIARPYTAYNQLRTFANIPSKIGLTDKTLPSFTQIVKNIPQGTTINRPPSGYEGDNDDRPIPKNVIAKNVQRFSPSQANQIFAFRDGLVNKAERGTLNRQETQYLTQVNKLIEQYLV